MITPATPSACASCASSNENRPASRTRPTRAPRAPEAGGEGPPLPGHAVRVHHDEVGRELVQPGHRLAEVGELAHREAEGRERLGDGLPHEVGCCLDDDLQGHAVRPGAARLRAGRR